MKKHILKTFLRATKSPVDNHLVKKYIHILYLDMYINAIKRFGIDVNTIGDYSWIGLAIWDEYDMPNGLRYRCGTFSAHSLIDTSKRYTSVEWPFFMETLRDLKRKGKIYLPR